MPSHTCSWELHHSLEGVSRTKVLRYGLALRSCATVLRYSLILVALVFRPARRSQQQRLDAMRVDPCLTGRPCEDGEMPVLRRHQRDAVALILNELRRRKVPCSPKRRGVDDGR